MRSEGNNRFLWVLTLLIFIGFELDVRPIESATSSHNLFAYFVIYSALKFFVKGNVV